MSDYQAFSESTYPPITGVGVNYQSGDGYGAAYTTAGDPANQPNFVPIAPVDTKSNWFKNYWRPAIAWQYFAVCIFDFIVAPSALLTYFYLTGQPYQAWQPLTLTASGLYHIAMGAIIGVAAYTRTQEKMNGVD
jgi:hypothetical protein